MPFTPFANVQSNEEVNQAGTGAVSSDVARTYFTSSQAAGLGFSRIYAGTSYVVFMSGDTGISSEIPHGLSNAPLSVNITLDAASGWMGPLYITNVTESSFFVYTNVAPISDASSETISSIVHWIVVESL